MINENKEKFIILVSIIIPTYRRNKTLKKSLESAINQSYENIEILVIDDNANGKWNSEVKNIIKGLNHCGKIIYVKNEINKGSAETRNIGINLANGEYITFLDDDDIYLKDKVKNQLNHMRGANADFSITDLALLNENRKVLEVRKRKYLINLKKENLLNYHFKYHMTGTDTMMFRKKYLLEIGGFEPIDVGDEFYLMKKAIDNNGIFDYVPTCDVEAVVHTNTVGLSSGGSKINGENTLYNYKKKYFHKFSKSDIRYIKVRHYAVLAFVEIRRKRIMDFLGYLIKSIICSPIQFFKILINR